MAKKSTVTYVKELITLMKEEKIDYLKLQHPHLGPLELKLADQQSSVNQILPELTEEYDEDELALASA